VQLKEKSSKNSSKSPIYIIYIADGCPNGKPAIGRGKMNKQRRKEKKISLEIGELQSFDCSTKVFTNHHIQNSNTLTCQIIVQDHLIV
jgi:hypothetical protein